MEHPEPLPAADDLQFRHAEPLAETAGADRPHHQCVACKRLIEEDYFHAQGQVVCPDCAAKIEAHTQAAPASSLWKAALYGGGAAIAGSILYALVTAVTHLEIGIMAIVVGIMVGKAIRYASKGFGGRSQQILAVALTYFAITFSYIPMFLSARSTSKPPAQSAQTTSSPAPTGPAQRLTPAAVAVTLAILAAVALVAPFLIAWSSPLSGLITLFIIYIGLQRAWIMTGRADILITGPYKLSELNA